LGGERGGYERKEEGKVAKMEAGEER